MANPFKIGLVMASASSAGAYTAGVLDFLLEALDAWEKAKQCHQAAGDKPEDWTIPGHAVSIEIISGTSAGALCAGLLGITLGRKFTPKNSTCVPPPEENRLYDTWVKKARIENLLESTDLTDGKIYSLLDSEYLTRLATEALQANSPYQRPNYVSPLLELVATNGNLRGVDYSISYTGSKDYVQGLVNHADCKRFYIGINADPEFDHQGLTWLNPDKPTDATWRVELRDAILASAAFPIGLAARKLKKNPNIYHHQYWPIPQSATLDPIQPPGVIRYNLLMEEGRIPPSFPEQHDDYFFAAVDGGITNNEPVEFARRRLAGGRINNPRNLIDADAAVLMIDPFPDLQSPGANYQTNIELFPVITDLIKTLLDQARFKLAELVLAQKSSVASRFMITPTRRPEPGQAAYSQPLASSRMWMFGGFLSESFREHDFQLGRLNCQIFLKNWFLLDADNPIFKHDNHPAPEQFVVIKDDLDLPPDDAHQSKRRMRAIIPLVGELEKILEVPTWPRMKQSDLETILKRMDTRANALVTTALHSLSWMKRLTAFVLWQIMGRAKLNHFLQDIITAELKNGDQLISVSEKQRS
ncbi:putative PNPLA domain-containing protein [Gammaproteobacteria bacterium]